MVKALLAPELRPLEHDVAKRLAASVLVRVGAGAAVSALVAELIDRFLA